ncbi:DNA-(apurinic or apyrimidinic site) lyase 2 isoform X3 [Canna indica]|uniref:DNA-(apurinic or apyrimidinic site) endonuclease 2 n=1 Tax=Canna indica TaxID=4628 RepID=A0AAQ3QBZ7_9LILI|nr:DNA-(apurinic or apyrimidinic site) lyase 2 isoform X3 [Canna indica]
MVILYLLIYMVHEPNMMIRKDATSNLFSIRPYRWDFLLSQGKRVFVVGDLNIAPYAVDRCDADPDFENNLFRKWLRSLLRECEGPFFDAFRSKNPGREGAYTCFSPNIGAEEFNYGSRIDHILIAGRCLHQQHNTEEHNFLCCHVEACDIMSQFKRGNSSDAPKWRGGRSIKLEGSDHVPVYVRLRDVPDLPLHSTPSLSVRYIPEVRGWQQTIVSFLIKGQVGYHHLPNDLSSNCNTRETHDECEISSQDRSLVTEQEIIASSSQCSTGPSISSLDSRGKPDTNLHEDYSVTVFQETTVSSKPENSKSLSDHTASMKKRRKYNTCSQLTLKSFFKQPKITTNADVETPNCDMAIQKVNPGEVRGEPSQSVEQSDNLDLMKKHAEDDSEMSETSISTHDGKQVSELENNISAVQEWQRIHQKMKMTLPICKGHGEPCVARSVKREGTNRGRLFYVCARAQGPASNPEANCGYFQWGSAKSKGKHK